MCCRVMEIREIAKPQGALCPNCNAGVGCRIYQERPKECASFHCGYLSIGALGEEWKPDRSRIVLAIEEGGKRLAAHVDLSRPDAWRREPYYSQLHRWSASAMPAGRIVIVRLGLRMWVILPDRDIELGMMSEEDRIVTTVEKTPVGPRWTAKRLPTSVAVEP